MCYSAAARYCTAGAFQCTHVSMTGTCFSPTQVCNGYKDCQDGSDENLSLCANRVCQVGVFQSLASLKVMSNDAHSCMRSFIWSMIVHAAVEEATTY